MQQADEQPVDGSAIPQSPAKRSPYSATVVEHGRNPKNLGILDPPDAIATVKGWCGEVMAIFLRLDGEQIGEATFMADGCLSTMACGDMLTTIVKGLTLADAARITQGDLIAALDGLPEWSTHCAELAIDTLREAIESYNIIGVAQQGTIGTGAE